MDIVSNFPISGACCDIQLTQAPPCLSVFSGNKIIITCKASVYINKYLNWHLKKPGKDPKLLICCAFTLQTEIPSRFSGSGSVTDLSLH